MSEVEHQLPAVLNNVPISVKPSTALAPPKTTASQHFEKWKGYIVVGVVCLIAGAVLAYLICTKKIKLPWLGLAIAAEEEVERAPRKKVTFAPELKAQEAVAVAPAKPSAPFGSGKRWTPIEALT
jgi:hypothetical protein